MVVGYDGRVSSPVLEAALIKGLNDSGIDAISVPAAKAQEFNEKMVRFYLSKDATEMMDFLARCHPDAEAILPPPEADRSHASGMEPSSCTGSN